MESAREEAPVSRIYAPATKPTMYFIGVTTERSSIMKVFPEWAAYLGLGDCALKGIDFPQHAGPEGYREAVRFIKDDPLSLGAVVTTHKIDLLHACRDLFDERDGCSRLLGEVSGISKRNGRLVGHAKDPIASGLALEAFLPEGWWARTGGEALLLGAGGSSLALSEYLLKKAKGGDRPSRIIVTNRSPARLEEMKHIHAGLSRIVPVEYRLAPGPADNDSVVSALKPHSLVVNGTGLGKDAPGSPITAAAVFPEGGLAWDFNYRGKLEFLEQARAQRKERKLKLEDGWAYFIYGWTLGIAEVFRVEIPLRGRVFEEISAIAARHRA